jgi:hypothetical protein
LLAAVAVAAASPVVSQPAATQTKASQQEAEYQPEPKNGFSCAVCAQFRPPGDCTIVAGDISAKGWCKFFDLPD